MSIIKIIKIIKMVSLLIIPIGGSIILVTGVIAVFLSKSLLELVIGYVSFTCGLLVIIGFLLCKKKEKVLE